MHPINMLLLVEDDKDDVVLTQRKIERSKIEVGEVKVAHNLSEAKSVIESCPIDVVFLDLNLGNESRGLDTLKTLRPLYSGIIIVITSIDDENVGVEAIRIGAEDYLVKGKLTEERLRHAVAFSQVRHAAKQAYCRMDAGLSRLEELVPKV